MDVPIMYRIILLSVVFETVEIIVVIGCWAKVQAHDESSTDEQCIKILGKQKVPK